MYYYLNTTITHLETALHATFGQIEWSALRNMESFFEYYDVIKYGQGWSNPIKPKRVS